MNKVAKLNDDERDDIFNYEAYKLGLTSNLIEKDYWVSYILNFIFLKSRFKNCFVFKGGTSLSKGYKVINRFSEDIDLILKAEILGEYYYTFLNSKENKTRSQIEKFKKKILNETYLYLKSKFLPIFENEIQDDLGYYLEFYLEDNNTIIIKYPSCIKSSNYIKNEIKLEIGPLVIEDSIEKIEVTPFIYDDFIQFFDCKKANIDVVRIEKTFWEKVTILYREARRPKNKIVPIRYSRHYYDVYQMGNSIYKTTSFKNKYLLDQILFFKECYYKETWMSYLECKRNGIKLLPSENHIRQLKEDYEMMKEMIFSKPPSFDEILDFLKKLEEEINQLIFYK